MNSSGIIGALLGGAVGGLAGSLLKHPIIGVALGAVGGGVAGVAVGNSTPVVVTLQSGQTALAVQAQVGQQIQIALPSGASWSQGDNTPTNVGTNGSVSWAYAGPGQMVLDWTDSTGATQQTTITFATGTSGVTVSSSTTPSSTTSPQQNQYQPSSPTG